MSCHDERHRELKQAVNRLAARPGRQGREIGKLGLAQNLDALGQEVLDEPHVVGRALDLALLRRQVRILRALAIEEVDRHPARHDHAATVVRRRVARGQDPLRRAGIRLLEREVLHFLARQFLDLRLGSLDHMVLAAAAEGRDQPESQEARAHTLHQDLHEHADRVQDER